MMPYTYPSDHRQDDPMNILDVAGVMAYTGLARQTIHQYHSEGLMPPADGRVGRSPWWYKATIDQWVKEREEQK